MSDLPQFASSISSSDPASIDAAPVDTAPVDAASSVRLSDLSHLTKVVVKTTAARPNGLVPSFGTSTVVGEALICGSRPDEWLVIGPEAAVAAAVGETGAHQVDLTHGRVLIEVAGRSAAATLEKVCSLDWSDEMMPDGAVTSASVAKVSCDVVRSDDEGETAYLIAADRSFGQYLHDALADAAAEFVA